MAKREYMIRFREKRNIGLKEMADHLRISKGLLEMLEIDDHEVTHPNIVERVSKAYMLTPKQAEGMLPVNYRKSSPEYDPDRYVIPDEYVIKR